jgi:hypothetical protein
MNFYLLTPGKMFFKRKRIKRKQRMGGLQKPKGNGIKGGLRLRSLNNGAWNCVYAVVFWRICKIKSNEAAKIRGAFYPVAVKKYID